MSIVGTRPPLISETNLYELHHKARLAIKPGITGMWQVSGRSDITDFEEVVRLDREYISNWNIGMDIKILVKTVMVVLRKLGYKCDNSVRDYWNGVKNEMICVGQKDLDLIWPKYEDKYRLHHCYGDYYDYQYL